MLIYIYVYACVYGGVYKLDINKQNWASSFTILFVWSFMVDLNNITLKSPFIHSPAVRALFL